MTNATTTAVDLQDCVSFKLQQNDLVTYIYIISRFFSIICCYKILRIAFCAV